MTVDANISKLVSHDASPSVIDQYINAVGGLLNGLGHLGYIGPITQVTLQPRHFLCGSLSELLLDGIKGLINNFLGY